MSRKKQNTEQEAKVTVNKVYLVTKPITHHASVDTSINTSAESGVEREVFMRTLKRASRKISEPES